ncbi:carbohydrate binding family 9 domain-containing protein [Ferrimonas futtsuensis]|uniref:carbohydrate binding family 9 domain-containing protein n=1 Tax=Ferrimonas futtsuensis TaxID=364764 RepID=UPI001FDF556F|nr:carbohydrate binding family 9 domain-containing protein [Ferrimonas futtsuensis]
MITLISCTQFAHAITLPSTSGNITIDAHLDDAPWKQATQVALTIETRPGENTPAPVATTAWIIADDDTLYVAFHAKDPNPSEIRANLSDRDRAWGDDLVGIKLDTWNQGRLAYQFFINPLGVQEDSIENELTGEESDAWDGIWHSAGRLTEDGYIVEIALPLRLFNFDDSLDIQTWGVELVRFWPRDKTYRLSNTPLDRNVACTLCQMSELSGLSNAKTSRQLQITPSLTLRQSQERDSESSRWESSDNLDFGGDLRWTLTPDTLLNLTVNPDFSQVEADAGQLDVNTTFALFFPEKRPFYLDNADQFETYSNLVHTRNLAEPEYGAKLTGARGDHSFGLLQTRDEKTNFLLPGNLSSDIASLGRASDNVALRYRYNHSDRLSLGAIATGRDANEYHNYTYGLDGRFDFSSQTYVEWLVVGSDTQYPEDLAEQTDGEQAARTRQLEQSGTHFLGELKHETRNWDAYAIYRYTDEEFRADLGFIENVDSAKAILGGGYNWYPTGGFFTKVRLNGDVDETRNNDGERLEREAEFRFGAEGAYQSYLALWGVTRERRGRRERPEDLVLDGNAPMFDETFGGLNIEFKPLGNLELEFHPLYGDDIDFANNQPATRTQLSSYLKWQPLSHIVLEVDHLWRELKVDEGTLFTANLTDLRLNWQFSVRSFLRLSAIFRDIDRDPSLYEYTEVDPTTRALSTELLYAYKVNPQTVFYAGYADGRFNDGVDNGLEQLERSVFAKFSYAWLL